MRQISTFADLFDSFINDSIKPYSESDRSSVYSRPSLNILESDEDFRIQYAAPGMSKEDVEVKIDEDERLQVTIEKKVNKEEAPEAITEGSDAEQAVQPATEITKQKQPVVRYHRREFSEFRFTQKFNLPEDVDKERISAKMENGLLEVRIPKRTAEEKARLQRHISVD